MSPVQDLLPGIRRGSEGRRRRSSRCGASFATVMIQTGPHLSAWTRAGWTNATRKCTRRTSTVGAHDHPKWTEEDRHLTRVPAGQMPDDVARPKGLEPLT